jgi:hypothetical protein
MENKDIVWDESTTIENIEWDESTTSGVKPKKKSIIQNFVDTEVGMTKNLWEGVKETAGGMLYSMGEYYQNPDIDRASGDYLDLAKSLIKADEKKRRQLGQSPRHFGFYSLNDTWVQTVDAAYLKQRKTQQETPGTSESEQLKGAKKLASTGEKIVNEAAVKQKVNLFEAGAKPGSAKEFLMNLGTGFGESVLPMGLTVLTKNPAHFLIGTQLSTFGKTYAEGRLKGASHEASWFAANTNSSIDLVMNAVPVGEVFTPANKILQGVIKQAGLEGTYNLLGSLLKSAAEKGSISPEMTLGEAIKAAGLEFGTGALTGGAGKFLNLTVFEPPKSEPKLVKQTMKPPMTQEEFLSKLEIYEGSIFKGYILPDGRRVSLTDIEAEFETKTHKEFEQVPAKIDTLPFDGDVTKVNVGDSLISSKGSKYKIIDKSQYNLGVITVEDASGTSMKVSVDVLKFYKNIERTTPEYTVTKDVPTHYYEQEKIALYNKYKNDLNKTAPDLEPRPMTEEDFRKVATGEIEMPTQDNPDTILPKHIGPPDTYQDLLNRWDSDTETQLRQTPETKSNKLTPEEKTRQTYTNTIQENLSEDVIRDYLPEDQFKYTPEQIVDQINTAKKNLSTDREGTIKRLESGQLLDSGVQVMELGVLIKEAEKANDDVALLKYTKLLAEKGTEYGRGLRAMQDALRDNQTPEGAVLTAQKAVQKVKNTILNDEKDIAKKQRLVKKLEESLQILPEDSKYIRERMKKAQEAPPGSLKRQYYLYDIEKRTQTIIKRATTKNKFLRGLVDYTTGNILWSPDTILWANAFGNLSRLAKNSADWFLHGTIHKAWTMGDNSVKRTAQAKGIGYLEGIKQLYKLKEVFNELKEIHKQDRLENPAQDFGEWIQDLAQFKRKAKDFLLSGPGSALKAKMDYHVKYLSSDPLSRETSEALTGVLLDTFGQVHGLNFDLMEGVDTVQKYMAYHSEARGEVHRQTELAKHTDLVERDKFEEKLWDDFLKYSKGDKTLERGELLQAIHEQALGIAQDSAWKGKVPESIEKLAQSSWFKLAVNKFVQTPYNMLKYNAKQIPGIDILRKAVREDLVGKNGVEAQTKAIAKQVSGFMLYGGITALTGLATSPIDNPVTANLTGGHPPEKRKALQEAGIPEYSYKGADGKWHSYRRYEPFATILASMITAKEYWEYYTQDERDEAFSIVSTALGALDPVLSSTMLKGLKDFISLSDQNKAKSLSEGTAPYFLNQERTFLPFQSLFSAIQRGSFADIGKFPYILETRNWLDVVNNTYFPWVSRPKLSAISGKKIENEGTFLGSTIDVTEIDQPALMKIAQLDMTITEPSNRPFGVKLNDKEYWEYRNQLDTKHHFLEYLNEKVVSPEFQNSPAGIQKKKLQNYINNFRNLYAYRYLQEIGRSQERVEVKKAAIKKMLKPSEPL